MTILYAEYFSKCQKILYIILILFYIFQQVKLNLHKIINLQVICATIKIA